MSIDKRKLLDAILSLVGNAIKKIVTLRKFYKLKVDNYLEDSSSFIRDPL